MNLKIGIKSNLTTALKTSLFSKLLMDVIFLRIIQSTLKSMVKVFILALTMQILMD